MRGGRSDHPLFQISAPVNDGPVELAIRPEAITVAPDANASSRVHRTTDYGTHILVDIELEDGTRLKAMCPPSTRLATGEPVGLKASHVAVFRGTEKLADVTPSDTREIEHV